MKIYFLIDDKNFEDFDDYGEDSPKDWVAKEIFNKLLDGSWEHKYSVKGGLKKRTTYYSIREVKKELCKRNSDSSAYDNFFNWTIVCVADVPDDYMIPKGIYAREDNCKEIVAPLPDYKSLSLHFHSTLHTALEKYFDQFDFDENPMTDEEVARLGTAFASGWKAYKKTFRKSPIQSKAS